MIQELEDVILTCDLPEQGLAQGDIGTVVLVHDKGKGYEVEFTTLDGGNYCHRYPYSEADSPRASRKKSLMRVIWQPIHSQCPYGREVNV